MAEPVPPPSHPGADLPRAQERRAIAALALAAFALNLNTNVLGALLPFVRSGLGVDQRGGEFLVAAAAAGSALGSLLAARLSALHGRRAALVGGLGAFVVASLLHLFVDGFWLFLLLRAAAGLAVGVAYAAASALAAEIAPYERRGAAMGGFNAGMFLAIPVGMPLCVGLAVAGHWHAIFGVQAVVGAVGCWLAWRAVPDRRDLAAVGGPHELFEVLRETPATAGLIATMLHVGSFFTTVQLATSWLDTTHLLPKEKQMPLWIGLGLASVAGSAILGRLSDRLGKRRYVLWSSLVLVACFALAATEPAPPILLGIGTLLATTAAARTGPLQALVSGLVRPERLAALMALRGALMQAGVVGFALVAERLGPAAGFPGVLLFAAVCQFGSWVAIRSFVPAGR